MDYHPFKTILNRFLARYVGGAGRPVFFDIDTTYPELNEITKSYPTIRAELERVLHERSSLPTYHAIDPGEAKISAVVDPDKNWNVFMLYVYGYGPGRNRALCPETCRVLARIPNLVQAFFSVLDPGKSIPLHEGPYLGYLRYHLALRVPTEHPPTLLVNARRYVWKAGEAVLFDDTWPHEVINRGEDTRAVLIVDVLRPLPFWPSLVNNLVAWGIARPTYGRAVARRVEASYAAGPRG